MFRDLSTRFSARKERTRHRTGTVGEDTPAECSSSGWFTNTLIPCERDRMLLDRSDLETDPVPCLCVCLISQLCNYWSTQYCQVLFFIA